MIAYKDKLMAEAILENLNREAAGSFLTVAHFGKFTLSSSNLFLISSGALSYFPAWRTIILRAS